MIRVASSVSPISTLSGPRFSPPSRTRAGPFIFALPDEVLLLIFGLARRHDRLPILRVCSTLHFLVARTMYSRVHVSGVGARLFFATIARATRFTSIYATFVRQLRYSVHGPSDAYLTYPVFCQALHVMDGLYSLSLAVGVIYSANLLTALKRYGLLRERVLTATQLFRTSLRQPVPAVQDPLSCLQVLALSGDPALAVLAVDRPVNKLTIGDELDYRSLNDLCNLEAGAVLRALVEVVPNLTALDINQYGGDAGHDVYRLLVTPTQLFPRLRTLRVDPWPHARLVNVKRRNAMVQLVMNGLENSLPFNSVLSSITFGTYRIISQIGSGSASVVWKARDIRTNKVVAVKCLLPSHSHQEYLDNVTYVYNIIFSRIHPMNRFFTRLLNRDTLLLDRCLAFQFAGVSLDRVLGWYRPRALSASCTRFIMWQLVRAVAWLIHTDLKPANISVSGIDSDSRSHLPFWNLRSYSSWHVRIIDLDDAVHGRGSRRYTVGTEAYRAPESCVGLLWAQPVDAFSIGCIASELSAGRPLFERSAGPLERLAAMERVIGPFPSSFISAEAWAQGYFTSGSRPTVAFGPAVYGIESSARVCGAIPLEEVLRGTEILLLCKELLCLDPAQRITLAQAKRHKYFSSYSCPIVPAWPAISHLDATPIFSHNTVLGASYTAWRTKTRPPSSVSEGRLCPRFVDAAARAVRSPLSLAMGMESEAAQ
ncbi:kinase-like domain-containing protein [Mycena polygramma]|nr:kinase-like domain-containing protein [Mycena polygramma]